MDNMNWTNIYLERCDKETENFIAEEGEGFLQEKISFLKNHKNEFIYIEGKPFEELGIDSLSFEIDDVFLTYSVLLGIKLPKKLGTAIRNYFNDHLKDGENKFALLFDERDGLWNINFTFNYVEDFKEDITFSEALTYIYSFLHQLVDSIK